jgi:hypothetical protein
MGLLIQFEKKVRSTKHGQSAHYFGEEIRTSIMHVLLHGTARAKGVLRRLPHHKQQSMKHDTKYADITQ